ncbi:MAG TPA: hypothetical protein VG013_03730 [Gemmataceae bacterium]|jgi:hypothetical protein|nr:hypothetical protein [Gemmataceae bacterium]
MAKQNRLKQRRLRTSFLYLEGLEERYALSVLSSFEGSGNGIPQFGDMGAHAGLGPGTGGGNLLQGLSRDSSATVSDSLAYNGGKSPSSEPADEGDQQTEPNQMPESYHTEPDSQGGYPKPASSTPEAVRPILVPAPAPAVRDLPNAMGREMVRATIQERGPVTEVGMEKKVEVPSPVIRTQPGSDTGENEKIVSLPAVETKEDKSASGQPAQRPDSSDISVTLAAALSLPLEKLLPGILPYDLAHIERAVDEFFAQVEKLGENWTDLPALVRWTPWLVAAVMATSAFELARRQLKRPEPVPFWVAARLSVGGTLPRSTIRANLGINHESRTVRNSFGKVL